MVVDSAPAVSNLGTFPSGDPRSPAIVEISRAGVESTCYEELSSRSSGFARWLAAQGFCRGDKIAIISDNSIRFMIAYLGILKAEMVVVPVNWRMPAAMVAYVLRDSEAALVLFSGDCADLVPESFTGAAVELQDMKVEVDTRDVGAGRGDVPVKTPAVMLYTSGSTGVPKGVILSHDGYGWVLRTRTRKAGLSSHRFLVAAPLYHMNALNTIQLALTGGATVILLPKFDAAQYLDAIRNHRCTWLTMVPTMISLLARDARSGKVECFEHVERVRLGSAPLNERVYAEAARLFPGAEISNGYGTTEIGSVVFGQHPQGLPTPAMSLGYPDASIELRLACDPGRGAGTGVLEVKTPAMMLGYHRKPDETEKVMTSDGFFITGDVMKRDEDGFYWYVGRADDMFTCGGENVYPGEVESIVSRHPGVKEVCVVPVEDEIKGMKPVAVVVRDPSVTVTEDDIRHFALEQGPAYLHPRRVFFVDSLPLIGTNKIDRVRILEMVAPHESAPSSAIR